MAMWIQEENKIYPILVLTDTADAYMAMIQPYHCGVWGTGFPGPSWLYKVTPASYQYNILQIHYVTPACNHYIPEIDALGGNHYIPENREVGGSGRCVALLITYNPYGVRWPTYIVEVQQITITFRNMICWMDVPGAVCESPWSMCVLMTSPPLLAYNVWPDT